jgi:hypothetical protein
VRRWYWCNVFMERYSSAVESKSRKDYLEMTRHWFEDASEPEVFHDAQILVGSPGFRIRSSASYASAVYSGVFCLLALRNARDWRRGEDIQLQALQDHHIFPQAYLKRHDITNRTIVNSIANRTLISDETNRKISDKAPAEYLVDADIFPTAERWSLLVPHFVESTTLSLMQSATEQLSNDQAKALYDRFVQARETTIIEDIRRVCGVTLLPAATAVEAEEDEVAADIEADIAIAEDLALFEAEAV